MRQGQRDWPVWDVVVRVIHWYFPLAIAFMWWSGGEGLMQWHSRVGYSLLVASLTRILWGFVGSYYARFANFLCSPRAVWHYIRGKPFTGLGHNPLGGWSSVALLLLVTSQATSGLFASDDILFEGPLAYWAGDWSATLGAWHETNWTLLRTLILIHVCAILFYKLVKKQALVQAMITGRAVDRFSSEKPVSSRWALVIAGIASAVLALVVAYAPDSPSYY